MFWNKKRKYLTADELIENAVKRLSNATDSLLLTDTYLRHEFNSLMFWNNMQHSELWDLEEFWSDGTRVQDEPES